MAETQQLIVQLDLKGNLASGIQKAERQLGKFSGSIARTGKGIGQIGAGLGRAGLLVGGAAVGGLVAVAKAAIDFEDAFAGVRKTVNEADLTKVGLSFDKLSTSFRKMATEIPISAVEFARLGETAGALGIKAQDIEEFSRVTALMGVTTNLSADEAADAFGRIGTILGLTGNDYAELADSIVALGNAGASTESEIVEITKRFAAQGKAAGLTKEEMVGLASATAALGFEPERGGTALSRVFANMATNLALANAKGEAFAKTVGKPISELQKSLNKGDGLEIFTGFLQSLKGLSATDLAKTLKAVGINNTSDRTIFQAMADQLPIVNEQLDLSTKATGALSEEATKRFNTIASKLAILKNNFIEAGITIGEGFLPALGRAAEKLTAFLKVDANKSQLKSIGQDIGKAIDGIDWKQVLDGAKQFVGVLKEVLSIAKIMWDGFNALPGQIKAAVAAFLVLNKASGGLLASGAGNVFGGVAETVTRGLGSKLPIVGSLFAQPVFVTNFPVGFGGTGGGGIPSVLPAAATGITVAGSAVVAGAAVAAAVIGTSVAGAIYGAENQRFKDKGLTSAEVAAVRYYGASSSDQATIAKRLGEAPTKADYASGIAKTSSMSTALTAAALETKRETTRGATLTAAASTAGSASVVAAIYANRPVINTNVNVNATTVTKAVAVNARYGVPSGSRNRDRME